MDVLRRGGRWVMEHFRRGRWVTEHLEDPQVIRELKSMYENW